MATRIQSQAAVRSRILAEAAGALEQDGPDALTVRRIAQLAGVSTQLIYTLFGGKMGLVDALYRQGFQSLTDALLAVPVTKEPVQDLIELGFAYRKSALQSPAFYGLMFGRTVAGYDPPEASRNEATRAFGVLVSASRRLLSSGVTDYGSQKSGAVAQEGGAAEIALRLWAVAHGMVSLELAGLLPQGEENDARYASHVQAICSMNLAQQP